MPTTTRTRKQYQRIRLLGDAPAPKYAICANGGHLLVDGVSDPDWHAGVLRRVAEACAPLSEVRAYLTATTDLSWVRKHRVAEDLFAYLVVERERLPQDWLDRFTAWAGERGWTVSLQGRKVYAVPRPLTKSAAVREVARRTGATLTLAAGDSLLDADLLLAADRGWRPGHGELADTEWTAPHVTALPERGVTAGERIVRAFRAAAREHTGDREAVPAGEAAAPPVNAALEVNGAPAVNAVPPVDGAPAVHAAPPVTAALPVNGTPPVNGAPAALPDPA
ncbi:HAD family hydrolase [Streptomyces sp. SBR177]